jgi:hypothetical protein
LTETLSRGFPPLAKEFHPFGVKRLLDVCTLKGCESIARGKAPGKEKTRIRTLKGCHKSPQNSFVLGLAKAVSAAGAGGWPMAAGDRPRLG